MNKFFFIYFKSAFIEPKKIHMNIYYRSRMKNPHSSFFGRVNPLTTLYPHRIIDYSRTLIFNNFFRIMDLKKKCQEYIHIKEAQL